MKKLLVILMTALTLFTNTISYAKQSDYSTVTVGLFYGETALDALTLSTSDGFLYGEFDDEFEEDDGFNENVLTITAEDTALKINDAVTFEREVSLLPNDGIISINSSKYRGGVILKAENSKITVINFLSLEEYLYGVIGSEMPSKWDIEALKAQAVCARSFAVTNSDKHLKEGFNLCPTTNCQVYRGIAAEDNSTIKAVDETEGELLMYDGKVAEALFFSSSGGHTADVKNVWGSEIPYLRGVEDTYEAKDSPRHSWSATLSNEDIKEALKKIEIDIGDIKELKATTDKTGRTYNLEIIGTKGTHTLKRTGTASPFASYGVISNKFTVTPYGKDVKKFYALSSSGRAVEVPKLYAINLSEKVLDLTLPVTILSASGKTTVEEGAPSGYIFNGGGWGHGVGMSQYGAKGMAEAGYDYDEILAHYYPGTYLE